MRSLSDLLDCHSDEDSEELKEAVRKAVEANRKAEAQLDAIIGALAIARDMRGGESRKAVEANRKTEAQFNATIGALAIPRDMREGESHRHTTRFERQPFHPNPFFLTTVAVAVLALAFSTAYLLFPTALTESDAGAKVVTARGSPKIVIVRPAALTGTIEQEEPPGKLEGAAVPGIATAPITAHTDAAKSGDVAGDDENGPAPSLLRPDVGVAKMTDDTRAAIDQSDVKTSTHELEQSARIESPSQNQNQDVAGALSTIAAARPPAPTNTTVGIFGHLGDLLKFAGLLFHAAIDQPDVKASTEKSARVEPPSQNQNQDVAGALSTIATVQPPAPAGTTEQEDPPGKLEGAAVPGIATAPSTATDAAKSADVARAAENGPAPSLSVKTFAERDAAKKLTAPKLMSSHPNAIDLTPNTTGKPRPTTNLAPRTSVAEAQGFENIPAERRVPVTTFPRPDVEVAEVTADTGVVIDRPDVKSTADKLKESEGVEPPGQNPKRDMAGALSVTCQTSGPAGDGHWAWRLIDGRKCWYKGAAGMDKSLLHWPPLEHVPHLQ